MAEIAYDAQDAVPEAFRDTAVEKDGKFVVDLVLKSDLSQFRERNIGLSQERDELNSKFADLTTNLGLDPDKQDEFLDNYKALKKIKQQVDDGKLVAETSLDEAIATRTGEMQRQHQAQIDSLKKVVTEKDGEINTMRSALVRGSIDREVITAVNNEKSGALPSATSHILREAYEVFKPSENGRLVPYDAEGKVMYGSDGSTPMTPLEWLGKLRDASPFFFKNSQGGGSGGGDGRRQTLTPAEMAAMSPQEKMNRARAGV